VPALNLNASSDARFNNRIRDALSFLVRFFFWTFESWNNEDDDCREVKPNTTEALDIEFRTRATGWRFW